MDLQALRFTISELHQISSLVCLELTDFSCLKCWFQLRQRNLGSHGVNVGGFRVSLLLIFPGKEQCIHPSGTFTCRYSLSTGFDHVRIEFLCYYQWDWRFLACLPSNLKKKNAWNSARRRMGFNGNYGKYGLDLLQTRALQEYSWQLHRPRTHLFTTHQNPVESEALVFENAAHSSFKSL